MLDINRLRNDFNTVTKRIQSRGKEFPALDQFKSLDTQWRKITTEIQTLNTERNVYTEQVAKFMKDKKADEANKIKIKVQGVKEKISALEAQVKTLDQDLDLVLHSIPNVPHESVQLGKDEKDNKEIRAWGKITKSKFKQIPHWEIAEKRDFVDFQRAVKISGSRFTIYRKDGAKLIRALQSFTLDTNIEAGFIEMLPPVVLNATTLIGTGQLPKFEEDLFKLTTNQYLSPTAEVQLTSFYGNEILAEKSLPIWLTANTACFRSEAGSAGKDTKGVIRQHQFYKTEMVMITKPKDSYASLEKMVTNAEGILQKLNLPYRTILLCTGDQGFSAAKTYDIEVWLPSYGAYKEISSCSNCEDFQARNLMMRYKDEETGKNIYPHTLNGSGLAIDRLWAAVVENYQQENGTIKIPDALKKYFDGKEFI
ncbi:MAG: serine--tRNA ligase [Mycoplasmataceae bacterium]|nr:serine--tRNA ligase [Mycoplasmataceae bacterium]